MTTVVVGDVLLDRDIDGTVDRLCPEAPVPVLSERSVHERPGGAGLAAMFLAQEVPDDVVLVGALSSDPAGQRLRELLHRAGIRVVAGPMRGPTPEKIRLRAGNHLLLRLDRGDGAGQLGPVPPEAVAALRMARAILVSDYGRGVTALPALSAALHEAAGRIPVVWDPHPRGSVPVPGLRLVTPNRAEAAGFVVALPPVSSNASHAVTLLRQWKAGAVAVTAGEDGAVLAVSGGSPVDVPAPFPANGDPCGAGDRFAATALCSLAAGMSTMDAVRSAVEAATAYVAAGGVTTTVGSVQ
jgi:D-beta-D-heptose 7-phosphate kinase/D-beta-D-heptose 1-phosphate adenosyltransferase